MAPKKPDSDRNSTIETIRRQQHTGNHERAPGEDPDRFAGTRAGADNVEPPKKKSR